VFDVESLLYRIVPILLALTVHEFAHAWTANRFGDPTAAAHGRLTLNPLPHLDILGTIMLLFGPFGWAKPVPVNPAYFRQPRRDLLWVSAAGPISNVLLAFVAGMTLRALHLLPGPDSTVAIVERMLYYAVLINLALAAFNLIPLHPLDGSKVLSGLLPLAQAARFDRMAAAGPFILLALILVGHRSGFSPLWAVIGPFIRVFGYLFTGSPLV
jgi:Zn-dependent protease